jgi:hypothetical protein
MRRRVGDVVVHGGARIGAGRHLRRLLKRAVVVVIGAHVLGLAALVYVHFHQELMVYQAFGDVRWTPDRSGFRFEDVFIDTPDGERLHGWYLPLEGSRGAILYCHGNAGNVSYRRPAITGLMKLGLDVFIFDYRGYGKSTGSPTEVGTYVDAEAAWRYLVDVRKIDPKRIVIWGRSLGGAIAIELAEKTEAGALVAESTFESLPKLSVEVYPIPEESWVSVKYPSIERVRRLRVPHLHAHSTEDDLIGMHHGRALFEASSSPKKKMIEMRGTHGAGHLTEEAYLAGVDAFLREVVPSP